MASMEIDPVYGCSRYVLSYSENLMYSQYLADAPNNLRNILDAPQKQFVASSIP